MHMIKKRQMVVDAEDEGRTAAELFSSLAASTPLRQGHLSLPGPPVQQARQSPLQRLSLLNDEYVVGVKTIGEQLWPLRRDQHQILQMPGAHVGLERQHHAGFQRIIAGAHNIRLLLMPPGADAMPDQRDAVVIAVLTKLAGGKRMNGTGFDPRLALLDGPAVDVTHEAVDAPLLRRGLPKDDGAGLMAGVAVVVGHIIVADDIARLENGIAFPTVDLLYVST